MSRVPGTEVEPAGTALPIGSEGATPVSALATTDAISEVRARLRTGIVSSQTPTGAGQPPQTTLTPASLGLHAPAVTPTPVAQPFITLGRYQLLSRLAVGGMAEVYLARQGELSGFKTLVVVKKVLPHLAQKPDFIAMFLDEARIASMLDHPNVVRINEVGRTESEFFLAMELVQGKPLAAILQHVERTKTQLPHSLSAVIVSNAAAGLHHAHQLTDASGNLLRLVHRDVSPQNIMVSFEGSVKVIDFGIARALGRLGDTSSGSLKGKLGYMAPEQARGEPIDARADIFSLGVVLWECVAGRRLFLRENELATLRAVVYEPIPKVSQYTKVDATLEVIIEHMLARDLEERFQTAEEVRVALERWVFAAGGTSIHDLSTLMKSWFPSDHAQWQRAAKLALDMQASDPPIDVAFPDLTGSRSGHSHTGTNRQGSGLLSPRARTETSNRSPGLQIPPPVGLSSVITPPVANRWRRTAVASIAAVVVMAAVLVVVFASGRRPTVPNNNDEIKIVAPARPTVEILPSGAGAAEGGGNRTRPEEQAGAVPRAGESVPKQTENASSPDDNAAGRKKSHSTKAEKRAIMHGDAEAGHGSRRHAASATDNSASKKSNKEPRPNPF